MLMEQTTEIQRIVIADGLCNLRNGIGRVFQKVLGVHHTEGYDVLHRRNFHNLLKVPDKPTGADVP